MGEDKRKIGDEAFVILIKDMSAEGVAIKNFRNILI